MGQAKQFQTVTALTIKFYNHKGRQLDVVKILYFTSGAQKSHVIYTKSWRCYHFGIKMLYLSCIFPIILLCFSLYLTHTHTHTLSPYTTCLKHIQTHRCTRACLSPVLLHTLYYSDSDTPLCGIHIYIHTYITLL